MFGLRVVVQELRREDDDEPAQRVQDEGPANGGLNRLAGLSDQALEDELKRLEKLAHPAPAWSPIRAP